MEHHLLRINNLPFILRITTALLPASLDPLQFAEAMKVRGSSLPGMAVKNTILFETAILEFEILVLCIMRMSQYMTTSEAGKDSFMAREAFRFEAIPSRMRKQLAR